MTQCSKRVRGKPFPPKACTLVRLGVLAGLNKVQTVQKVLVGLPRSPKSWPGRMLSREDAESSEDLQCGQHSGAPAEIKLSQGWLRVSWEQPPWMWP